MLQLTIGTDSIPEHEDIMAIDSRESKALMRDYHVYSWYWKSKKKTHWKRCSYSPYLKELRGRISQIIDWNVDPFGQDVEHVLMDNILKYGDNPTVNQRDRASTTPELWGPYLTVPWLEWWSIRSRCRACSNEHHTKKLLVLQYDDNTEYKFIGRSLMSRYPNPFRP